MKKRLTVKEYLSIIDLLENELDLTPIDIAKIHDCSSDSVYDINKGRTKLARELWGGEFPIRAIGAKRTAAIMNDLRDGMEVEEVIEKWRVSKHYANILKRRVKKENEQ